MWYEILPSLGLVYVFITAPHITNRAINWFFYNGKVRICKNAIWNWKVFAWIAESFTSVFAPPAGAANTPPAGAADTPPGQIPTLTA